MDEEINNVFEHAPPMPPALAAKIREQILRDTQPVKPMMSAAAYGLLFFCTFVAVAILFAFGLGFSGLHVLSSVAAAELLCLLAALAWWSGAMVARSMRPGSGNLHSWLSGGLAFVAYEALVMTLFRDYSTTLFMQRGVACLAVGVMCAAVAALPMWLVVRRGFIVDAVRAGAVIGLVSGLAGLTALTLHCPYITAPHTGVWHAAVIVVCVGLGSILGRISQRG